MSTVFMILILVAIFGVPLYTVGRITWFLTSELKSKMARRLWLASALCAAAGLMIFGMFGELQKFSRPLYDVLGTFFALSFVYFVIDMFWRLLHWLTREPYTPLVDELGSPHGEPAGYSDYGAHRKYDSDVPNGLTMEPNGFGSYSGGIDHSSSFDHQFGLFGENGLTAGPQGVGYYSAGSRVDHDITS